jgi:hypothetical protein
MSWSRVIERSNFSPASPRVRHVTEASQAIRWRTMIRNSFAGNVAPCGTETRAPASETFRTVQRNECAPLLYVTIPTNNDRARRFGRRVLVRLGIVAEEKSYAQTYRGAMVVLSAQGRLQAAWLVRAYLLLRDHGRSLCKRSAPVCEPCPLDRICAHRTVTTGL